MVATLAAFEQPTGGRQCAALTATCVVPRDRTPAHHLQRSGALPLWRTLALVRLHNQSTAAAWRHDPNGLRHKLVVVRGTLLCTLVDTGTAKK